MSQDLFLSGLSKPVGELFHSLVAGEQSDTEQKSSEATQTEEQPILTDFITTT